MHVRADFASLAGSYRYQATANFAGFTGSVRPGASEDGWTGSAAPCDAYRATCLQFRLPPMMRPAAARGEGFHDEAELQSSGTVAQHLTDCHRHGIAHVPMATLPCSFIPSPTNRTRGRTRANVLTPQQSHLRFRLYVMLARTRIARGFSEAVQFGGTSTLRGRSCPIHAGMGANRQSALNQAEGAIRDVAASKPTQRS